jgi:hypothetical protein
MAVSPASEMHLCGCHRCAHLLWDALLPGRWAYSVLLIQLLALGPGDLLLLRRIGRFERPGYRCCHRDGRLGRGIRIWPVKSRLIPVRRPYG